jgi:SAM-dependent methyltransferase
MKKLVEYGIASTHFKDAQEAHSHTYMTNDGRAVSTLLIFTDNPYNVQVAAAKHILDIGSGTGRNLDWIMQNTEAQYHGVDPNPSMHEFFWDIQDTKWQDRTHLYTSFDLPPIHFDVVVCTFVFQHIGFRPPTGQMNVVDITKEALKFCTPDTVWIMYEHDWEEPWIWQWMEECDILPQVILPNYKGIPELTDRGAHHLIIWTDR